MNDWLLFIIASFAAYRAGRMMAEEDGPAFIFRRLRDRFTDDDSAIAAGVRCFYCLSFWFSLLAAIALVVLAAWDTWLWLLYWFGIAGAAAKIHEFWRR